jgi:hypothetical protein
MIRRFVFVAEGDVFMQLQFDDETAGERSQAWAAGLNSSPTVIEVTDSPDVVPGWTWDGTSFSNPNP